MVHFYRRHATQDWLRLLNRPGPRRVHPGPEQQRATEARPARAQDCQEDLQHDVAAFVRRKSADGQTVCQEIFSRLIIFSHLLILI